MGSIYDVISGKTFRVNLNSFFQVNVKGAELLYAKAAQWALAPPHDFAMPTEALLDTYAAVAPNYAERLQELTREFAAYRQAEENAKAAEEGREPVTLPDREVDFDSHQMFAPRTHGYPVVPLSDTPDPAHADKTLLLDICCGTGTIGLIMSDNVQRVVGLELVPAAIEDAKANAELNSVTKASFVCGKAESTLGKVIHEHRDQMDFAVGIVDPPRSGLHNDVLTALRASSLKRIVYVSCNATTLADNVARLAGPTTAKYKGAPFIPVVGVAVDMFPHTPHCEVVMMLERAPEGTVFPEPEPEVKAEKAQKTEDATEEVKSEAAVEEATAETVVAEEGNEK
jgi:tRNA (uracil-5-)-methyltransferase